MTPLTLTNAEARDLAKAKRITVVRPVKPQPTKLEVTDIGDGCTQVVWSDKKGSTNAGGGGDVLQYLVNKRCPLGAPGTRLWCKESYALFGPENKDVHYASDHGKLGGNMMKRAITMPKKFSRHTVVVEDVQVKMALFEKKKPYRCLGIGDHASHQTDLVHSLWCWVVKVRKEE